MTTTQDVSIFLERSYSSEPLERQDGERTKQLEREAIASVREFDPRVVDLKVDVFGSVAVTTFVMDYRVVDNEGERHKLRARATMVLANHDGEWLIVHEHFSPFVPNSQNPAVEDGAK